MNVWTGLAWLVYTSFRRRSSGSSPILLLFCSVVGITLVALLAASAPGVARGVESREASVSPVLGAVPDSNGRSADQAGELRMVDPFLYDQRRWKGQPVVRHYYASGGKGGALKVPGVATMPDPGEYVASPALAQRIAEDPTFAALFSGHTMSGEISESGLVDPHELRAVVGVADDAPMLIPVVDFGSTTKLGVAGLEDTGRLNSWIAFMVLLLIGGPAVALLVLAARLKAGERERRARLLRRLGAARLQTRSVDLLESLVVAIPASLVGLAVHAVLITHITRVPFTQVGYFSEDAALGTAIYASVCAAVVIAASLAAAALVNFDPSARAATAEGGRLTRLGPFVLVAGLVLLGFIPILVAVVGTAMAVGLWVGCGLVAVGLALAGPTIVRAVFTAAAHRARSAGALVGTRLAGSGTGSTLRLASMMCVIVVALLGAVAFSSILNGGRMADWQERVEAQPKVPVVVNDLTSGVSLSAVEQGGGGPAAQLSSFGAGKQQLSVVFADCNGLRALSGSPVHGCDGKPAWITSPPKATDTAIAAALPPTLSGTSLPPANARINSTGLPKQFTHALLLPSSRALKHSENGAFFYTLLATDNLKTDLASLSSLSPTLQFNLGKLDENDPDLQQFPVQFDLLMVAAAVGMLLGALALVVTTLGDVNERSSRLRGLRVVGAPASQMLRAHLLSSGAPLAFLGILAVAFGWVMCRAMLAVDDRAQVAPAVYGWLAGGAVIVALVVTTVTWPDARQTSERAGGVSA